MKVKDIAEFKDNKDINMLLATFQRNVLLAAKFGEVANNVAVQTETTVLEVGLVGIEIVKEFGGGWNPDSVRVDLYRKSDEDEWMLCYSAAIDGFATAQLGVWETIASYREKLKRQAKNEKKRKFCKGDLIQTVDELLEQEFVYWGDKLYNRGWFMSWQLRMTMAALKRGSIYHAIRKDDDNA